MYATVKEFENTTLTGNLEEDIKFLSDKAVQEREIEQQIFSVFSKLGIAGIVVALLALKVSLAVVFFVVGSISSGFYFMNKLIISSNKESIGDINKKLNHLDYQLEVNDVSVSKIELQSKVEILKSEKVSTLKEIDEDEQVTLIDTLEKYWSFMDRNEQIQVLKYIKTVVVNNNVYSNVKSKYFLLEEEDKNNLDEPLKRVLKINK